jgi:hypothetical protein
MHNRQRGGFLSSHEFATAVSATATFDQDRRYVVTVQGPRATVTGEPVATGWAAYALATTIAESMFPAGADLYVEMRYARPSWLRPGQAVRIPDADDGRPDIGWVRGFESGAVVVAALRTDGGIYAPECLDDAPALSLEEIAAIDASQREHEAWLRANPPRAPRG